MTGQGVRLDKALVQLGLVTTRSQAESYIRLGRVKVAGRLVTKPGYFVHDLSLVELDQPEQFVSRAGLKLASVADKLAVDFRGKLVLDVGSSTGGFTDYALSRGARRVICVDVGTDQLHPKLRRDARVELHEKTDIRDFVTNQPVDIILIDVSFISLREVLPHLAELANRQTQVVAMVKPQFETGNRLKNHGVIKNDTERRRILHDFEQWVKRYFLLRAKADSAVAGARGNRERFYLLTKLA
ncbi:TlyA family RNA methyltransferase [Candidatus Nanoperiomorbus periodonticus]|uniref:TlyA family RNA methyltransferase n=1 Tax=Candidatus Nanoperiomorbus periodonticus TaxID=2171989 RepID=UPI00101D3F84|nr:TlyA family RNA methyltransferase [Candidatus Nanoperiomorbus periodonticus]RYC75636.1 16S/23S rRNA (cytidine-2'-O)-methyltransferase TlyA [Candidatus Nanoperiomorbus periodonticus]